MTFENGKAPSKEVQERIMLFWDTFLPMVAGAKHWCEDVVEPRKSVSGHCTPSDEAFAIIVLENYWRFWMENLIKVTSKKISKMELMPYTTGRTLAHCGWSNQGIE